MTHILLIRNSRNDLFMCAWPCAFHSMVGLSLFVQRCPGLCICVQVYRYLLDSTTFLKKAERTKLGSENILLTYVRHITRLVWIRGVAWVKWLQWLECSTMVRETSVQSRIESYQRLLKWYLIPPFLTLSTIRYVSRVKQSNLGKGVATSPTPQCSSYWKEGL